MTILALNLPILCSLHNKFLRFERDPSQFLIVLVLEFLKNWFLIKRMCTLDQRLSIIESFSLTWCWCAFHFISFHFLGPTNKRSYQENINRNHLTAKLITRFPITVMNTSSPPLLVLIQCNVFSFSRPSRSLGYYLYPIIDWFV